MILNVCIYLCTIVVHWFMRIKNLESWVCCSIHWHIKEKSLNSDGQQFHQSQQKRIIVLHLNWFELSIEHGRWNNIPRENRKCNLCNLEEIGDEFHYILNCPYFKQYSDIYIKKRYTKRPNIINFLEIMASTNKLNLTNLCKFIRIINERVCTPS